MVEGRLLQTGLWLETHLARLSAQAVSYYIVQRGAYASGTVLVKISNRQGQCRLMVQERDLDGVLGWAAALGDEILEEKKADSYISRAVARDPDLWVVEVEDPAMINPFED